MGFGDTIRTIFRCIIKLRNEYLFHRRRVPHDLDTLAFFEYLHTGCVGDKEDMWTHSDSQQQVWRVNRQYVRQTVQKACNIRVRYQILDQGYAS